MKPTLSFPLSVPLVKNIRSSTSVIILPLLLRFLGRQNLVLFHSFNEVGHVSKHTSNLSRAYSYL